MRPGYEQGPVVPELRSEWFVNGYGKYGTATVWEVWNGIAGWRVSVIFKAEKANTGNRVREFDLSEWRKIAKCLDDE